MVIIIIKIKNWRPKRIMQFYSLLPNEGTLIIGQLYAAAVEESTTSQQRELEDNWWLEMKISN